MSTSTLSTVVNGFITTLWSYIEVILPILLPVLVVTGLVYGAYRLIARKAHV